MDIRALSVRNPYAGEIADGLKTIELRSWRTHYRGPLVICATARPEVSGHPYRDGVAIALVDLVDCRTFMPVDGNAARSIWRPDMFAWVLAAPRPLPPIPVTGRLGLFRPPSSVYLHLRKWKVDPPAPPIVGMAVAQPG